MTLNVLSHLHIKGNSAKRKEAQKPQSAKGCKNRREKTENTKAFRKETQRSTDKQKTLSLSQ